MAEKGHFFHKARHKETQKEMLAAVNQSQTNPAIRIVVEQHLRTMLNYYTMRSLIDGGEMAEMERTAIRASAIETRRYGFRLEAQVEPLCIRLDAYDEERLRKEANRIAHLARTNETEAKQAVERVISDALLNILEPEQAAMPRAA
jgi:hypothetical protein